MRDFHRSAAVLGAVLRGAGVLASGLALAACGFDGARPTATEPACADLESVLTESLELGFPGTVLVASRGGVGEVAGAAGVANLVSKEPMTPGHAFHVASVSKLFTAVAILRLVDEGKLSLGDGLVDLVDTDRLAALPWADEMTVRQLLDHSAGTYPTNNDPEYIESWLGERAGESAEWTADDFLAIAARNEPSGRPGEGTFYSDTNYILLAMVIEAVTGWSYREHLDRSIFRTLGLSSARFFQGEFTGPQTARGYLWLSEEIEGLVGADHFMAVGGKWLDTTSAGERIDGASSIVMNGLDLHAFGNAVFRGDLLSPASRGWLLSVGKDLESDEVGSRARGAMVARRQPSGVVFSAEGDGPSGVHSIVAYDPAGDVLVVGLTNSFGLGTESEFFVDRTVPHLIEACRRATPPSR